METQTTNTASVTQLASFYRGELSAVETYALALKSQSFNSHRATLERVQKSHQERVGLLGQRIRSLGGKVPESSGAWGTFTVALEGLAAKLGLNNAIAMLEQGEDHGLADYRRDLDTLDSDLRNFVQDQVLTEQIKTHAEMSMLKKQLS